MGNTTPADQVGKAEAAQRDDFTEFRNPNDPTLDRLVQAVDRAYNHPWLMLWRSFFQGMVSAIGAVIGTLIIFAVLGIVFKQLGGLDLLRPGMEKVQEMIIPQEYRNLISTPTPYPSPTPSSLPSSSPTP